MPKYRITAEFWIECCRCNCESVVVHCDPDTHRSPKTKAQAWAASKANGWAGSGANPICPECTTDS